MEKPGKKFPRKLLILLPAIGGAFAILAATPLGIGIYSDSVMYLLMARSLLQGHGLTIDGIAVTLFPPLYPMMLSLSGMVGVDPVDGARWFQAIVMAINIFWVGIIMMRFSGRSIAISLFASAVMLGAVDMVAYHALALSDGALLFFFLPALLTLSIYLEEKRRILLIASGLLFSLGSLTRYAGLTWSCAGILSILLVSRKPRRERIKDAWIFACLSLLASAIWMFRNMQYNTAMGRSFDAHAFFGTQELASLEHAFSAWFFQWTAPDSLLMILVPGFLFSLLLGWFLANRRHLPVRLLQRFQVLFMFIAVYVVALILSAAFFQADLFRDCTRLLLPLHVLFFFMGLMAVQHWWNQKHAGQFAQIRLRLLGSAICIFLIVTGMLYADRLSRDGQGFASAKYRSSPLLKRIKSISPDITIYSNLELPLALYTGRSFMSIPEKVINTTQRPNRKYDEMMKSMTSDLKDSSALLVYIYRRSGSLVFPTLDEIERFVPLRCIGAEEDGGVYEAVPDTSEAQ